MCLRMGLSSYLDEVGYSCHFFPGGQLCRNCTPITTVMRAADVEHMEFDEFDDVNDERYEPNLLRVFVQCTNMSSDML